MRALAAFIVSFAIVVSVYLAVIWGVVRVAKSAWGG